MFKEIMIVAVGIIVGELLLDGIRYVFSSIKNSKRSPM